MFGPNIFLDYVKKCIIKIEILISFWIYLFNLYKVIYLQ